MIVKLARMPACPLRRTPAYVLLDIVCRSDTEWDTLVDRQRGNGFIYELFKPFKVI